MPAENAPTPKQLIAWNEEKMTSGVPLVDQQHCALIDQINALHAACVAGTGREELLRMMHFLGEYAQNHFADEERIMDEHACPSRAANKAAHLKFLHRYGDLLEKVKKEGASTSVLLEIKDMLGDWLKNHICKVDTKLRQCMHHQDEPHTRAE
jgi:hemerythrin-like metal-binding protein